jgi:hypothetical protein
MQGLHHGSAHSQSVGQYQHVCPGHFLADNRSRCQSIEFGQDQVHEYHIGIQLAHLLHCLRSIDRFAHHVQLWTLSHYLTQPFRNYLVIIDNQYPDPVCSPFARESQWPQMATSSLHIGFRPFDLLRPAGALILLPLRLVRCSPDCSGASIQRRRPESVLNGKSLPIRLPVCHRKLLRVLTPMYNWLIQLFGEANVMMGKEYSRMSVLVSKESISQESLCPHPHGFPYLMASA